MFGRVVKFVKNDWSSVTNCSCNATSRFVYRSEAVFNPLIRPTRNAMAIMTRSAQKSMTLRFIREHRCFYDNGILGSVQSSILCMANRRR